ncbi:rod shape-determining protein MreC [Marinivivus vitaminiproducens]|uniref:rod shape-determining protein MreC n=1 Tax=Marinivivus vitaminiproducens TaxID=3035935 RepID=UPI0027AB29CE|nr:rod shape-determining protein MreC [Geminicoccaceae bacterium SCSIO 64248]
MRRPFSRSGQPVRTVVDRLAFGGFLLAAVLLLLIGKADLRIVAFAEQRLSDVATPLLRAAAAPVGALRLAAEQAAGWWDTTSRNAELRAENAELLRWKTVAEQLAAENAQLREALAMKPATPMPVELAARVVADGKGPFVDTLLIDAGSDDGVRQGMAAITHEGLVGRVLSVGRSSARLLLVTDFNSKIPVRIEPSGDPAILAGDNTDSPALAFLPFDPRIGDGDLVLTSGRGGGLPAGLPVGRVVREPQGELRVASFIDWRRLDLVRLILSPPVAAPEDEPVPDGPSNPIDEASRR